MKNCKYINLVWKNAKLDFQFLKLKAEDITSADSILEFTSK